MAGPGVPNSSGDWVNIARFCVLFARNYSFRHALAAAYSCQRIEFGVTWTKN